jgi:hypothetical protein
LIIMKLLVIMHKITSWSLSGELNISRYYNGILKIVSILFSTLSVVPIKQSLALVFVVNFVILKNAIF